MHSTVGETLLTADDTSTFGGCGDCADPRCRLNIWSDHDRIGATLQPLGNNRRRGQGYSWDDLAEFGDAMQMGLDGDDAIEGSTKRSPEHSL